MLQYMRALLFLCLATLISFSIVLSLMDVPFSMLLAAIAFPLGFVPLVGPHHRCGPDYRSERFQRLSARARAGDLSRLLSVFFRITFLSPHLMSRGVELHPLLVIFGVFAGGEIGGVSGVFLSVPVLALIRLSGITSASAGSSRKPRSCRHEDGRFCLLLAAAASAHVISMSTRLGHGRRQPRRIHPAHAEIRGAGPHGPAQLLFDHIHFYSGFETGRLTGAECHDDPATANYLCAANYQFSAPVDRLRVECTFYEVTVPNHIHMLHARTCRQVRSGDSRLRFLLRNLAFRPPTATELMAEQAARARSASGRIGRRCFCWSRSRWPHALAVNCSPCCLRFLCGRMRRHRHDSAR